MQFSTYPRPVALDRPRHARVQHLHLERDVRVGVEGRSQHVHRARDLAGAERAREGGVRRVRVEAVVLLEAVDGRERAAEEVRGGVVSRPGRSLKAIVSLSRPSSVSTPSWSPPPGTKVALPAVIMYRYSCCSDSGAGSGAGASTLA